ncbi:unnamed protein product, partial [Ixodes persulcatus]
WVKRRFIDNRERKSKLIGKFRDSRLGGTLAIYITPVRTGFGYQRARRAASDVCELLGRASNAS